MRVIHASLRTKIFRAATILEDPQRGEFQPLMNGYVVCQRKINLRIIDSWRLQLLFGKRDFLERESEESISGHPLCPLFLVTSFLALQAL